MHPSVGLRSLTVFGCWDSSLAVENPNAKKGRGTGDMIKGILAKAKECVRDS